MKYPNRSEDVSKQADKGLSGQSRIDFIYEDIRDRICLLEYEPGTILRENELSAQYNVSRTPIREAILRLRLEGLVESKKSVGTIVTGFDFATLKDAYAVRIKIIEMIPGMSDKTYSDNDVADMEKLYQRLLKLKSIKDVRQYWEISNKTHEILGRIIANGTLMSLYDLIYYKTARSWFYLLSDVWQQNLQNLQSELSELIKFMRIKDVRGTLMTRRNYIVLFLSMAEAYYSRMSEKNDGDQGRPIFSEHSPLAFRHEKTDSSSPPWNDLERR